MPERINNIQQLVAGATLNSIDLCRVVGERYLDIAPTDEFEVDPSYTLKVTVRDDAAGFRVLFGTDIETPLGAMGSEVVAEYAIDGFVIGPESTDAMAEFVNNVALMHVVPYARQSIADVSLRVFNAPLLMPMIQRGEITFDLSLSDPAALAAQVDALESHE